MKYKDRKYIEIPSELDAKILLYAINHIDWTEYDPDEHDGESIGAACIHLDDIETQLCEEFDIDT